MYSKLIQSDTESNVSGFIYYSEDNIKRLYTSAIENIQIINEDILEVQKNLKAIVKNSGHLEKQVTALLLALPQPSVSITMEE